MPALFAVAWIPTTVIGVSVENQFTVFGAAGAVLFMLLSGLLLARFDRPGILRERTADVLGSKLS